MIIGIKKKKLLFGKELITSLKPEKFLKKVVTKTRKFARKAKVKEFM